jgi:hypothetical protein
MTIEITTNGGTFIKENGTIIIEDGQSSNDIDLTDLKGLILQVLFKRQGTGKEIFQVSMIDTEDDVQEWNRHCVNEFNETSVVLPMTSTYKLRVTRPTTVGQKKYDWRIKKKV